MPVERADPQITSFTCLLGRLNDTNKQDHVTIKPLNINIFPPSQQRCVCVTLAGAEPFLVSHMPRLLPMSPGFTSCDKEDKPRSFQSYAVVEKVL